MVERLPGWCQEFIEAHGLAPDYLASAQKWFDPMARVIAEHQNGASRPWLVALNGSQGSGKSTLSDYLCALFQAGYGLRCAVLSLDDFYLTADERRQLASDVHPLFRTRGVPGTHDTGLLKATLEGLLAGEPVRIPRFDKARDDRRPESGWDSVAAGVDIVLLEGWCLGATAQPIAELARPVNALEADEDSEGRWRDHVNAVLARDFPPIYQLVDCWAMLRAPSFDCVYGWRLEQEQKLALKSSGAGLMSAEEITRFIQFYQRLTEHCLARLPAKVNHLFELDGQRAIQSYTYTEGVRV
ncbi:hypothetical protein [Haliea sp. E17]|uniref:hypothetical protein n=1 Tax=Haliea sp. E17 TaxID=3401576 RepID=UPI003AB0733D